MGKREKKFNKWLIGAVIGGAVLGAGGLSMTPKGKSFWKRTVEKTKKIFGKSKKRYHFFSGGIKEMKKTFKK